MPKKETKRDAGRGGAKREDRRGKKSYFDGRERIHPKKFLPEKQEECGNDETTVVKRVRVL